MNKHLEIAYHHLVNGLVTFEVNSPQWKYCMSSLISFAAMTEELHDAEDEEDEEEDECDLCARCQCSS